jgi:hypothetical protein
MQRVIALGSLPRPETPPKRRVKHPRHACILQQRPQQGYQSNTSRKREVSLNFVVNGDLDDGA